MDTVRDNDYFSSSDGTDSDDSSTPGSVTDGYSSSDDDIDNIDGGPQNMPGFQLQPVRGRDTRGMTDEDFIPDLWWFFNRMARVGDVSWCECTFCLSQPNPYNSFCCQENMKMFAKLHSCQGASLTCITEHPGFKVNCLNIHVLEKDYHRFKKDYGPEPNLNRRFRYVAYRNLILWIYGLVGEKTESHCHLVLYQ